MALRSNRDRRKEFAVILCLVLLALAMRSVYLYEYSKTTAFGVPIIDSGTYDRNARRLLGEGTLDQRFIWQGFFYPFYLFIVYSITGGSVAGARIVQALLGSVLCLLVYALGRRFLDRRTGVAAAVIAALCGPLVFFEVELLATGWATIWAVLLILLVDVAVRRPGVLSMGAAGIAGGLSIITRVTFVPFLVVSGAWLFYRLLRTKRRRRATVAYLASCTAGLLLVVLPVASLCHRETGVFSPLPQSGPINLYIGNNPDYERTITIRPGAGWRELTRMPMLAGSETERGDRAYFMNLFLGYVRSDPAGYLEGLARKAVQFVSSRELPRNVDIYTSRTYSRLSSILTWKVGRFGFPFGLLLPLALIGIVRYRRRLPPHFHFFVVLYPAAIVLVFVTSRYRTPLLPVLAVPAAAVCLDLFDAVRGKGRFLPAARKGSGSGAGAGGGRSASSGACRWRAVAATAGVTAAAAVLMSIAGPFVQERYDHEAELHTSVGFELGKQNRLDEAETELRRALALDPGCGDTHKHLGLILSRQRRHAEAEPHFERALEKAPGSYFLKYYLGITKLNLGERDRALGLLREALDGARAAKEPQLVSQIEKVLESLR